MAKPSTVSPVLTSRPPPSPPVPKPPTTHTKTPNPPTNVAAQFHRFRLSEFTRDASSPTTTSAPAGQCSRFRVSDFVPSPWTSDTPSHTHTPTAAPVAVSPVPNGRSAAASPGNAAMRQGSFSVMHMDVDGAGPQQTSSSVAAAAGSGRGVLQKVAIAVAPVQAGMQKAGANLAAPRPLAPSPIPTSTTAPKLGFDPSTVPQEAVWELSRIMTLFRHLPAPTIVAAIQDALMKWPSLDDGSLLRRIGEVFPPPPPPPPAPAAAPPTADQTRKKRGRPPGKRTKLNDGTAAPVPIAATPLAMAPPPPPQYPQPVLAPAPAPAAPMSVPVPPLSVRGKNVADKLLSCTRCLKAFNPTWRATPASDPSSEATCAVKHPYKGFETGLEAVTLPRRKNNYKTTWKWKCCGREVQSTSEQLLMWPRKEDDRTGGWCFVGKHTTEPGVREKLGLKPGKGKKINEEIGKKRKKTMELKEPNGDIVTAVDEVKGWLPPGDVDLATVVANGGLQVPYGLPQQQQSPPAAYPQTDSAPQSDDPPKRKRGRPKGSKTRSKIMQMAISGSTKELTAAASTGHSTGPEQQLMNEASQQQHSHLQPHNAVLGAVGDVVQDQNSFWTQYTEPNLEIPPDSDSEEHDNDDDEGDEEEDEESHDHEDPAISTADLTLLASATAAMSAAQTQAQQQLLPEEVPEKRKRGRPKGSRNGKMAVETTQKALRMKPTPGTADLPPLKAIATIVNKSLPLPPLPVPDPVVTGTDEGAPFVGMGGMDYGGLGSGDGGGWFG